MKILLVDDHEMVRLGLKSYFDLQEDVEVVGEAANGVQGISLALELRPDVIVMDIVMPEMNGIDATLAILKEWPEAKILIVTSCSMANSPAATLRTAWSSSSALEVLSI